MGQLHSYTQPSSSESYDMNSLLESEAQLYKDEAESSYQVADAVEYPINPEADDGIPRTCYCGGAPLLLTSYTAKDPGRRYFTCDNADDGDCHIWKWWDVAITEEMSDFHSQLRMLKEQAFECDQKLVKLQKHLCELSKKKAGGTNGFALVVWVLISAIVCIGLAVMYVTQRASKK